MADDRAETPVAEPNVGVAQATDATAKRASGVGSGASLTCSEAARRLGVTRSTVIRHEKAGRLRATRGEGGVRYFAPDEVDATAT